MIGCAMRRLSLLLLLSLLPLASCSCGARPRGAAQSDGDPPVSETDPEKRQVTFHLLGRTVTRAEFEEFKAALEIDERFTEGVIPGNPQDPNSGGFVQIHRATDDDGRVYEYSLRAEGRIVAYTIAAP